MESFREQKDTCIEAEKHFVNKVDVERYLKESLSDHQDMPNNKSNLDIYIHEKNPMKKLSRRSASGQRSVMSSFMWNNKSSNLLTSFREMNNFDYQKQVCRQKNILIFNI